MKGDLRLSIGNFQGQPTAVVYRKVADAKKPKTFSSGVIKEYVMDSVVVLTEAKVAATVDAQGKRYVVEAAIPLAALGLKLKDGLALRGDFGATHGDKSGKDTRLRTHWNNQHTGIVDDEVFELRMEPANWGVLTRRPPMRWRGMRGQFRGQAYRRRLVPVHLQTAGEAGSG